MEKVALLGILIASILATAFWVGLARVRLDYLSKLVMHRRSDATLLTRRMVALDLDPYELRLSDPALLRHLQMRGTLCDNCEFCVQDLARESGSATLRDRQDWRDYCPNALALDMLVGLQSRSRTTAKYSFPYLG